MGSSQHATHEEANRAPTDVVELVGYLSEANSDGYRRLYKDLTHKMWIELDGKDIVHVSAGDDSDERGQSVISVGRKANLVKCEAVHASIYATSPKHGPGHKSTTSTEWPRH
jgi:hypothetical protein